MALAQQGRFRGTAWQGGHFLFTVRSARDKYCWKSTLPTTYYDKK